MQEEFCIFSESELIYFYGKLLVSLFGTTYCSHCRDAIHAFKEQILNVYSNDLNIWINVIGNHLFDVEEIP